MLKLDKRGKLRLTERQIEEQIKSALEHHGWRVLRTNKFCSGNAVVVQGSVEPGIPDLLAYKCLPIPGGLPYWDMRWIEVKRPGEKLSEKQEKWWRDHPDESKRVATCLEDIEDLL